MTPEKIEMFWAKVNVIENACWEWNAALNGSGYGIFGVVGKKVDKAHRISYRMHKGEIGAGLFVCHKCDNRKCVNPDHLFLGTNHDNVKDMIAKGRNSPPPAMGGWNKKTICPVFYRLFGKEQDTTIATLAGCSKHKIQRERNKLNIAPVFGTRFK